MAKNNIPKLSNPAIAILGPVADRAWRILAGLAEFTAIHGNHPGDRKLLRYLAVAGVWS